MIINKEEEMERITKQQQQIYGVLRDCKCHPTMQELTNLVHGKYPSIGQATVYRSVNRFVQKGLVTKLPDASEMYRYDVNFDHHHFRCKYCGKIEDVFVDEVLVKKLSDSLLPKQVVTAEMFFSGICESCKEK